ncbi:patatin family protein [Actinomyces sp. 2119]|uniref:patatin-like phospholipase family protein n=1 Tax=Actinomyces sp. 2119 TaxID=2321393 RepID=UPI000E6D2927|nr:patatin family protein [Actinomyces sp. 2119]RJF40905.1 patatin family protein [Actinomyces sp. 2119]
MSTVTPTHPSLPPAPARPVPASSPGHVPAPVTHGPDDVALVFEGGGMRGAYTAGLVRVMLEAGLSFPWVGGISAGASHTCNFVSRDTWRAREAFVGLTTQPQAGGWGSFARGQGYFNSEYIYERTSAPDEPLPFDWETFASTSSTVRLGSFRCDTGEEVYWGLEDMPTMAHLLPRVRASSSMPVLMPVTHVDGVPYLDGALGPTGGFATDAARADGYDKMLVVMTRPAGYRKPERRLSALYRALLRRYPAAAEGVRRRPQRYNQTVADLEAMQREGRVYLFRPARMPVVNGDLRYHRVVTAFEAGLAQARQELPAIEEFLAS